MSSIILFDGECNFCDQSVQFILKRDSKAHYQFASLQSEAGKRLVNEYDVPNQLDSMILMDGKKYYTKSTAALRICGKLDGLWKIFYGLLIIPRPIRDVFYGILAKNRYKWFGKKDSCMLPSPEVRDRFL
ncbi:thiol-disulfide oxidoreductase DCC family protein [Ornithinibacillus salinisoli]|uniref:Thiol-disulfide oxidoreductase DCC family protein n=1 Tax=Ornithinibacillus salinisoli TaxID=1848459 RepID=A0ABW4VZQ5_9BACI